MFAYIGRRELLSALSAGGGDPRSAYLQALGGEVHKERLELEEIGELCEAVEMVGEGNKQ